MEHGSRYDSRYHTDAGPATHGYHTSSSTSTMRDSQYSRRSAGVPRGQRSNHPQRDRYPKDERPSRGFWGNGFAILLVILALMSGWMAEMLLHHSYGDTGSMTTLYCILDGAAGLIVCLLSLRLTFSRAIGRRHGFGIHILGLAFLLAGMIMVAVAYLVYIYSAV